MIDNKYYYIYINFMLKFSIMNFDQLKYFKEAARLENLGTAAKSLNISISSISYAIKQLELELDQKLFEKKGRNIFLTQVGKELARHCEGLFNHLDDIVESLISNDFPMKGRFKISMSSGLESIFFLPFWNKLQKKYPELILELSTAHSSKIVEMAANRKIDFGLCYDPIKTSLIESKTIAKEPHLITVAKSHDVLKVAKNKRLNELLSNPCCSPLAYPDVEACKQHKLFQRKKLEPQINFYFASYNIAAARLMDGRSWCYLPKKFSNFYRLKQVELEGFSSSVSLEAVWPGGKPLDKPLEMLLSEIKNSY